MTKLQGLPRLVFAAAIVTSVAVLAIVAGFIFAPDVFSRRWDRPLVLLCLAVATLLSSLAALLLRQAQRAKAGRTAPRQT
jgi:hypothetical protein